MDATCPKACAQELAARFSNAGEQLQQLQAGVVSDLKANVDVINQLAKQIVSFEKVKLTNNEMDKVST